MVAGAEDGEESEGGEGRFEVGGCAISSGREFYWSFSGNLYAFVLLDLAILLLCDVSTATASLRRLHCDCFSATASLPSTGLWLYHSLLCRR